ncbi:MAG: hypothetical protein BWY15_02158 [Firmicutes bacterium ADurb.Bin193]|nr:MAG: hypothetical protein BWY15_02158 [Firmicutes bacterium ADurb.Bin193]
MKKKDKRLKNVKIEYGDIKLFDGKLMDFITEAVHEELNTPPPLILRDIDTRGNDYLFFGSNDD